MAHPKNSLVRSSDLRVGKSCFCFVYKDGKYCVQKTVILFIDPHRRARMIRHSALRYGYESTADRGVIGHAYDLRPTQLFNNRRSAQFWLDHYQSQMNPVQYHFNFFERGIHN